MKAFSSEMLKELNAQISTGRFVEAFTAVRNIDQPDVLDYFINWGRSVSFRGHIYTALGMKWEGIKTSAAMELPTNQISISNLGGTVVDYLENEDIDINQNDVYLQVLFIDRFGRISLIDEMLFQVELIVADYHKAATLHLGVNYSLNDLVPQHTLEKIEYPSMRDDVIRVGS